jgi:hypothetical protein
MSDVLYRSVIRVRPTSNHEIKGWAFGWLALFLKAPASERASSRASIIVDQLPYEVVETFGLDSLVGTHPAAVCPPPVGHEKAYNAAQVAGAGIGLGLFLLHVPIGTDEQDFTQEVRKLC